MGRMPGRLAAERHLRVLRGVMIYSLQTSFGAEVAYGLAVLGSLPLKPCCDVGQGFVSTNRRSRNDADAFRRNVSDDRFAIVAKPMLDSGIYYLKTRAVPPVPKYKIAGSLKI